MCEGVRVGVRTAGGGAADEVEQLMHRPVAADLLEALDDDSRDETLDAAAVDAEDTERGRALLSEHAHASIIRQRERGAGRRVGVWEERERASRHQGITSRECRVGLAHRSGRVRHRRLPPWGHRPPQVRRRDERLRLPMVVPIPARGDVGGGVAQASKIGLLGEGG